MNIIVCWGHSAADSQNVSCQHLKTPVECEMGGSILCKTVNKKDLGVTMNTNLKVPEQSMQNCSV